MKHKKQKVTMQLIADRLGVSKFTVSQALSMKIGVSESTRREVEAMARALGYQFKAAKKASPTSAVPSASPVTSVTAASVVTPDSAVVAVTADSVAYPEASPCVSIWIREAHRHEPSFWSLVIEGAVRACKDKGWKAKIMPYNERLTKADTSLEAAVLSAAPCLGSIVLGTIPVTMLTRLVLQHASECPVILVDHEEPLLRADCILNANLEAAQIACRHLLAQNCQRIIFVGKDHFSLSFKDRWWGCRQAMDEVARKAEGYTLKKWTISYNQPNWEQQLAKRVELLHPDELPDGFICANDAIALSLLRILHKSVLVPRRCKVIGIDNIGASASSQPPLTTVELAKELLGRRAVEALARKLTNPSVNPEKIILSARLIIRSSG